MALEAISRLEEKVNSLVDIVTKVRQENADLKEEIVQNRQRIKELESEKHTLAGSVGSLKVDSEERQKKLDEAAEKIENLLTKLESVA